MLAFGINTKPMFIISILDNVFKVLLALT